MVKKENTIKQYIIDQVRVILDANEHNKYCDEWQLKDHIELILEEL
tara:strand:- start:291 stop:428 length:138 start_codon:yes stop_codon:yes gene_type:complete